MSALGAVLRPGAGRPSRWRTVILVAGALGCGALCARVAISAGYGTVAIEALIALPVLVALFRRPALALLATLATASSLLAYSNIPRLNLPGHPPLNLADLLLAVTVLGTLWRRPWQRWPPVARRFLIALALTIAVSLVATIKTLALGHVQARGALYDLRNWFYLAAGLTVALELRGRLWRQFFDGAVALAALVSVFAVAGAASGTVQHLLQTLSPISVYSASATSAASGVDIGSIARIRVQGLFFVYWMVLPTLGLILTGRDRRLYRSIGLVLMLAAIGVSLNRNMYGGLLIGLLVMALLAGTRVRFRLAVTVVAAIAAATLIFLGPVSPAITAQIGRRASTVLSPAQLLQSNSAADRSYELTYALPSIARHPWFGVGPRQGYGALLSPYADTQRFFVQDLYVWLATDFGIPTAVLFLFVPGVALSFGVAGVRRLRSTRHRGLLAGLIGSLVAMLLSSAVEVFLQDPSSTLPFGVACGAILALGLEASSAEADSTAHDDRGTTGARRA